MVNCYATHSWSSSYSSSRFRLQVGYRRNCQTTKRYISNIFYLSLYNRTIDPTKILVTGKRVRFNFIGISDIALFDPNQSNTPAVTSNYQQEDLTSLGKLVLALACRCLHSVQDDRIQSSISILTRNYSSDLRNLVL